MSSAKFRNKAPLLIGSPELPQMHLFFATGGTDRLLTPNEFPFISSPREITFAYEGQVPCEVLDAWILPIPLCEGDLGLLWHQHQRKLHMGCELFQNFLWCGIHRNESEQGSTPNTSWIILENSRSKSKRPTLFLKKKKNTIFYLKRECYFTFVLHENIRIYLATSVIPLPFLDAEGSQKRESRTVCVCVRVCICRLNLWWGKKTSWWGKDFYKTEENKFYFQNSAVSW